MKYIILAAVFMFSSHSISAQLSPLKDLSKTLKYGGKTYGSYCGFAGQHPPTRIAVEALIADRDIDELSSWLRSPNLVVQTYAAEAFIRLSADKEVIFADADLTLVETIRVKKDKISTCTGCILESLTIEECLSKIEPGTEIGPPENVR